MSGDGLTIAVLGALLLRALRDERAALAAGVAYAISDEVHQLFVPGRVGSPLDVAIGRQAADRYETALQRLKPEEREVLIARVELGMSFDEVAAATGRPSRCRRMSSES